MIAAAVACTPDSPAPAPTATATGTVVADSPSPTPPPTQPPETETAPPEPANPPPLEDVAVSLERVAVLDAPIAMAVRPGEDALYIAERPGRVRVLRDGNVADRPVLDISDRVSTGGELGLLGLAFSPDGDEIYVSFTNRDGDSRVLAYPMDGDRANTDGRRQLLAVDQPYSNHNGGHITFGPDDMLYVGLGDGGSGGDPQGNGQDPSTLLGKLLRLDERGQAPADNPFVDTERYAPEIFALGLRNPWRFSFDRASGDLWVADVGQNSVEEINMTPANRSAGRNYGWNLFEGSQPFAGGEEPRGVVRPVEEYPTSQGCAVTGGYVYRGGAIPDLRGAYLYSDFCAGWVRAVRVRGGETVDAADLGLSLESIASFGQDADGELYVLSLDGTVARIAPG